MAPKAPAMPVPTGASSLPLAEQLRGALRRIRQAQAGLVREEGRLLQLMQARSLHHRYGFARFADFAREILQMHPRTVRRRLRLYRVLEASRGLDAAFSASTLSPCKVLALAPLFAPAPPDAETTRRWIALAGRLSVRDLEGVVQAIRDRDARARSDASDDDEIPMQRIAFSAPPAVAFLFEQAMETARRTLGWNAPRYRCVEALLAESGLGFPDPAPGTDGTNTQGAAGIGNGDLEPGLEAPSGTAAWGPPGSGQTPPNSPRGRLVRRGPWNPRAVPAARQTLSFVTRELEDLDDLLRDIREEVRDPVAALERLRHLDRPLRVLLARLLHHLVATGGLAELGYRALGTFAEVELQTSERTARHFLQEADLLDGEPLLESAYGTGRLGLGKIRLIRRIALARTLPRFVARARRVTHRQFVREVAFLERLQEFLPELASRHPGPLPSRGLASALREALGERGWTGNAVDRELKARRVAPVRRLPGTDDDEDPAADPLLMSRLEVLLELVVLTAFEDGVDRQTLSTPADRTVVGFRAPAVLACWWNTAVREIRRRCGPIPVWAAVTLLIRDVLRQWERHDPDAAPTHRSILERDGYRCCAPGCSSRRNLEVHHVVFRSRGGTDRADNRITLCHAHHRLVLHAGHMAAEGLAPSGLVWRLGAGGQAHGPVYRNEFRAA